MAGRPRALQDASATAPAPPSQVFSARSTTLRHLWRNSARRASRLGLLPFCLRHTPQGIQSTENFGSRAEARLGCLTSVRTGILHTVLRQRLPTTNAVMPCLILQKLFPRLPARLCLRFA